MWPTILGCLFLAVMISLALVVGVLLLCPQLLFWPLIRLTRGRWLLRLFQHSVFELSGDRVFGYWFWDIPTHRIYLIGKQLDALGYERQWVEQSCEEVLALVDADERRKFNQISTSVIQGQEQFATECRLGMGLSAKPWVRLVGKVLWRDKKARARLAYGRIENIGEIKTPADTIATTNPQLRLKIEQQEAAILQDQQSASDLKLRLQQVLDTAQVALCWKNVDGVYLGCNQRFADLVHESSPESVQGKTDFDLTWTDSVAEIIDEDKVILTGRMNLLQKEAKFASASNQQIFMNCLTSPVRDKNKTVVGIFRTYEDISARRRMEDFAHKERQLMQEILDGSNAMITIVDRHYCFLRINQYFESTMGLKAKDVVGRHVSDVIKGPKGQVVLAICDQIVTTGVPVTEEYSVPTERGGRRTFIANVTPVFDESGKVDKIVTVSTDVTELKQAQIELEESRNKAEQAASVKSRFLANMSHEIRTPMNAILGLSHLALATDLDAKQLDYLTKIHFSAENLLGIVNDILDFSKIEAGKLALVEKVFDLRVFMDNLCSIFEIKTKQSNLRLHRDFSLNTPPFIRADALRLHQILVNLIGNAIKFTPSGSVTVELRMSVDMGARLLLNFAVVDTGVGLTKDQIGQLFVAFEQVDAGVARQYGGTGLGLTISRRLVEMLGGEIKVSSEAGKGSRFEFTVNVGRASPADVMELVATTSVEPIPNFQGAKILLVEDNEINLLVATEILAPFNLSIDTACNGAEAVEKVARQDFALVLMDIQMPVMDGYRATIKIREMYSAQQLPIIGLTANAMYEDRKASHEAGMNAHIAKPIDIALLAVTLRRFLPEITNDEDLLGERNNITQFSENSSGDGYGCAAEFLPDLDVNEGLSRLRGRKDRYQELLISFVGQYETGGKQCIALIERRAFLEAKGLAHQIKGVAGNLSANKVYAESQALEAMVAQGVDVLDVKQTVAQCYMLQAALDELAEAVGKLVKS